MLIRQLIEQAGLSQRGAARAIGINERTMRKYCAAGAEVPLVVILAMKYIILVGEQDATR